MTRLRYFLLFLTLNIFKTRCGKVVLRTGDTTGDIVVKYLPNVDEEIKELTKVVQELKGSPKGKFFQGIKVLPKRNEEPNVVPELVGMNIETEVEGSNILPHVGGINNLAKPKVEAINNLPKPVEEVKVQPKENVGNIQMENQISVIQPNKAPEVLNQLKVPETQKKLGRKKHRFTKEILKQIGGNTNFIEMKKRKIEEMKRKVAKIRNQLKADKKDNYIGTKDEKNPIMRTDNKDKHSKKKRKNKVKLLRSRFAIETKTEKTSSTITTSYSPVTRKKTDSDGDDEPVMREQGRHADDDDLNFDLEGEMLSQIV